MIFAERHDHEVPPFAFGFGLMQFLDEDLGQFRIALPAGPHLELQPFDARVIFQIWIADEPRFAFWSRAERGEFAVTAVSLAVLFAIVPKVAGGRRGQTLVGFGLPTTA